MPKSKRAQAGKNQLGNILKFFFVMTANVTIYSIANAD